MSRDEARDQSGLGDAGLVAIVGGISEKKAVGVVDAFGGLGGLVNAGMGEIADVAGLAAAARFSSAIELSRRALEQAARATMRIVDSRSVYAWAQPRLVTLHHEELWVLALDGNNGLRAARRVGQGGLHGMSISPRDVIRVALREGASAMVIVHNHPSGNPEPSEEDRVFTQKLAEAARVAGVPLVDHVVVARSGYRSIDT